MFQPLNFRATYRPVCAQGKAPEAWKASSGVSLSVDIQPL
jgi:hypothetical protein